MLLRLDHAVIRIKDEATLGWYRAAIGLAETGRENGTTYLTCGGDGNFDLGLMQGQGPAGLDHVAFAVDSLSELEATARELKEAGVRVTEIEDGQEPNVEAAFSLTLPTEHRMEVVVAHRRQAYIHPTADWQHDAVNAPYDLNHVTFGAADPGGLMGFLHDRLRFHVSDVWEVEGTVAAAFTRIGENHHDIAILGNAADGLHHVAFQVTDVAALQFFADRIARLGYRSEYGIGRHGPGGNLFLYVRDPSGNRVELTAGAPPANDPGGPTRVWKSDFLGILNVWAPIPPPDSFGEVS